MPKGAASQGDWSGGCRSGLAQVGEATKEKAAIRALLKQLQKRQRQRQQQQQQLSWRPGRQPSASNSVGTQGKDGYGN